MPDIQSITLNGPVNLIAVRYADQAPLVVTQAEAQAWIDGRPNASDAQIERQMENFATGRWVNRTDTIAVHLINRSPVVITVYLAGPGQTVPPNWWA